MRTAFIDSLIASARLREDIFLVVGDLGYSVVEPYQKEFPDRFLNAGVAEQNMTGVAAGLASEGYHVFTYSIANFPTLRCLEQIRNDICYHNLPVTVVSVGAGVAYGNLGYSHHAVQDIGIMSSLPGMTVLCPADPGETTACVHWLAENPCPSYLRIGKAGEPRLHAKPWEPRHPLKVISEPLASMALVCTGSILQIALDASGELRALGVPVDVFSVPWLHPLTSSNVEALSSYKAILTVEEHLPDFGLGSLLRTRLGSCPRIRSLGIRPDCLETVGSQIFLREKSGLTSADIIRELLAL